MNELPLFPLRTVMFPRGQLSLKVFEQRYLDLVRDCVRDDGRFGVSLVTTEGDGPVGMAACGTSARISDWFTRDDGLLGIVATGEQRYRLERTWTQPNGLLCARVEWLEETPRPVPPDCSVLVTLLRQIIDQIEIEIPGIEERDFDDASFVAHRLAELLPLELMERQSVLEIDDPESRLREVFLLLRQVQERQRSEENE